MRSMCITMYDFLCPAASLTLPNIILIGIGSALLSLATIVSLCRLCLIGMYVKVLSVYLKFFFL